MKKHRVDARKAAKEIVQSQEVGKTESNWAIDGTPVELRANESELDNDGLREINQEIAWIKGLRKNAITNANGGTIVYRADKDMLERIEASLIATRWLLYSIPDVKKSEVFGEKEQARKEATNG